MLEMFSASPSSSTASRIMRYIVSAIFVVGVNSGWLSLAGAIQRPREKQSHLKSIISVKCKYIPKKACLMLNFIKFARSAGAQLISLFHLAEIRA